MVNIRKARGQPLRVRAVECVERVDILQHLQPDHRLGIAIASTIRLRKRIERPDLFPKIPGQIVISKERRNVEGWKHRERETIRANQFALKISEENFLEDLVRCRPFLYFRQPSDA